MFNGECDGNALRVVYYSMSTRTHETIPCSSKFKKHMSIFQITSVRDQIELAAIHCVKEERFVYRIAIPLSQSAMECFASLGFNDFGV
jgi:hypothetical protein